LRPSGDKEVKKFADNQGINGYHHSTWLGAIGVIHPLKKAPPPDRENGLVIFVGILKWYFCSF
jgi:hypothetical protein